MVSLRSRLERKVDTGLVGTCEDSGDWTPFALEAAGGSVTVSIAHVIERERLAKNANKEGSVMCYLLVVWLGFPPRDEFARSLRP